MDGPPIANTNSFWLSFWQAPAGLVQEEIVCAEKLITQELKKPIPQNHRRAVFLIKRRLAPPQRPNPAS